MGTTLTGNKIKDTYKSLIKITDSTEAGSSAKQLSDGDGNDLGLYVDTDGVFGIGAPANVSLDISSATDAIGLPVGTTANRPTGAAGQMRYNSTTGDFELYDTGWTEIFTTDGGTVSGDVTITGDLIVQGTTVTLNTETIEFEDNILQLNTTQGTPDTATGVVSGISIYRGDGVTQASFLFDDADDTWDLTNNLVVDGSTTVSYLSLGSIETTPSDFAFVYRPTNSSIAMGAAGSEIMRLTAGSGATFTGNFAITSSDFSVNTNDFFVDASSSYVAIGHVNPLYPLHIINSNGNIFKASTSDTIVNMFLENNTQRVDLYSNRGAAAIQVDQNDDSGSYDSTFAITIDNNRYLYINTAGDVLLEGGDLIVDTDTLYVDSSNNRVGIGTDSPSELLHIHRGDSGGVANNAADEVLVEGSGDTGITISSPSTNIGTLAFGDNDVTLRGAVRYDHSNDSMDFRVSSNTRMTIDSSGRVGIGTDSPVARLEIEDSGANLLDLTRTNVGTYRLAISGDDRFSIYDVGADEERLSVDSSGNVGIGINSPDEIFHTKQANATILVQDTDTAFSTTQAYIKFSGSDASGNFRSDIEKSIGIKDNSLVFEHVGSETMRIDSSGNVGIGTDSPSHNLTINSATGGQLQFQYNTSARLRIEADSGGGSYYAAAGFYHRFFTSGTERLRIDSSGRVGINESNPTAALHVVNSAAIGESIAIFEGLAGKNGYVYINADDDRRKSIVFQSGGVDKFSMGVGDSNELSTSTFFIGAGKGGGNNADFVIDSSGNVGIGTTNPASKLYIEGATPNLFISNTQETDSGLYFRDSADSGQSAAIKYGSGDNAFKFYNQSFNTERMRIDSSGNVGIGITSPSSYDTNANNLVIGSIGANDKNGITIVGGDTDGRGAVYFADTTQNSAGFITYLHSNNSMLFGTSDTERMRITSGGNIGIGLPSPQDLLDVNGTMRAFGYESRSGTNGIQQYTGDYFNIFWTGSTAQLYIGTSSVGTITLTSDYRVKKNIETQNAAAIDRINALRPVKFEYADYEDIFVADNVQREGFIAHEVAEIIPSAVEGEKDAENALQSLKLDAMMSVAVKAIQEQQEIINDLKARIETLENQ
jgi:hypothetical protein